MLELDSAQCFSAMAVLANHPEHRVLWNISEHEIQLNTYVLVMTVEVMPHCVESIPLAPSNVTDLV